MSDTEQQLIEKLQRIEALFARAGTEGEKAAAASAAERIRARLMTQEKAEPAIEFRFSSLDGWSRRLFLALLARYNIKPYRYRGQRRATLMVRVPARFMDEVLWPEYVEFNAVLKQHLSEITDRIISQAVSSKAPEGDERPGAPDESRLREEG